MAPPLIFAIIFLFLQEKVVSIDEFLDYTAKKTSKRWKAVLKNIPDMMNSILLNVLSNGEKIVDVKIGDTEATAVVSGLLRSDLIANYSCPAKASERRILSRKSIILYVLILTRFVTLQSRVASLYEWRTGVKAKRCPGRPVRWNHKALGSSRRGRGRRPPAPHFGEAVFSSSLGSSRPMLPARTARTPRPQQNWFRATRD